MWITTKQVSDMTTGDILSWEGYWYPNDAPLDLMGGSKKARKQQEEIAANQLATMNKESARRGEQQAKMEPTLGEFEAPGQYGLNKYSAATYAQDLDNIGNTYAGLRRAAIKAIGGPQDTMRSGLALTKMNALDQSQGIASTNAYRSAMGQTLDLKKLALGVRGDQASDSGRQSLGSGELASNSALRRSQMGSTFGDIVGGVSDVFGMVSSIGKGITTLKGALGKKKTAAPVVTDATV